MEYVAIGCGVTQAVVFTVAVAGKARGVRAFHAFARSLVEARLVRRGWRTGAAACVILVEAAVVPLLATPGSAALGFAVAATLCAVLTGAVTLTLLRRIPASCLCFGARPSRMGWPHAVRNAILAAVAGLGYATATAAGAAGATGAHPVRAAGVAVAVCAGAVGALLLIRFDDLAHIFHPADSLDRSVLR
ncbi:MauE/DoxX family redox-associated membrane protein [Streptosporangium sp. NPDC051023]|uniref:MauE/DoxX family redox-associated membrane protein n=1 Tax=Streptosporangium sp. NPDC051023 TaxID=3155410 RepID=UPI00344E6B1A